MSMTHAFLISNLVPLAVSSRIAGFGTSRKVFESRMNLSSARVTADPESTSMSHLTPPTEPSTSIIGISISGDRMTTTGKVRSVVLVRWLVTEGSSAFPADVAQSTACPATHVAFPLWPASPPGKRSPHRRKGVAPAASLPSSLLPPPCASSLRRLLLPWACRLAARLPGGRLLWPMRRSPERGGLPHHALFLGRNFNCLRETLRLTSCVMMGRPGMSHVCIMATLPNFYKPEHQRSTVGGCCGRVRDLDLGGVVRKFTTLRKKAALTCGESCLELLQQDFLGRTAHLRERLREEAAQVTSKHPHVLTPLLLPPEKLRPGVHPEGFNRAGFKHGIVIVRFMDIHGPHRAPHLRISMVPGLLVFPGCAEVHFHVVEPRLDLRCHENVKQSEIQLAKWRRSLNAPKQPRQ
ncbi:hypothetical protein T4C_1242 [Trichinella pseudospiralis]|uniref:Uncharacterized protein n=1 Tax=Trichinella pseudospiralis TaxID=6337 RepID=A0A0V1K388_TRIPS|nr:hypothetical protein T4C_1242 [Trichinella pseudospiralis]